MLVKCCYGISSKANDDGGHVLMFDYDGKDYKNFKEFLLGIQQGYSLSNIYIIKSTHGYNAICLDIMPITEIFYIGMRIGSPCDKGFFKYGYKRGYYTLRFDDDKHLFEILKSPFNFHEKSLVHKTFLEWFFNIIIDFDNKYNDYTKLRVIQYPSKKNGFHVMEKKLPSYLEVCRL